MKQNKLKVSVMSGKLKGIPSINTNPLKNPFCITMSKNPKNICSKCYASRSLRGLRKNCNNAFEENGKILSKLIPEDKLPKFKHEKSKYVRFSSFGDLLNDIHLINYFNIAVHNPNIIFGLWTKRKDIIKKFKNKIPKNVITIYSTPQFNILNPEIPEGFRRVFSNYSKDFAVQNRIKINCGKTDGCLTCKLCYNPKNNIKYINELIK